MNILIVNNTKLPVSDYGGTERIIWWLGRELVRLGHEVGFLVPEGSSCPFAKIYVYDPQKPLAPQIPKDVDVVHLHFQTKENLGKPYIITHHGNVHNEEEFNINTVFVSRNQAQRNASTSFVLNGIDPQEYGPVDFGKTRKYLLFLAYARRPEKNLKDCAFIARKTNNVLAVVGGRRKWFKWRPWLDYKGFIGGEPKNEVLRQSKALIFPVLWHEPCAVSIFEALYFGCPVIGTPYGCLPELICNKELGFLSNSRTALIGAVKLLDQYNPRKIHEYAMENLSAGKMTQNYLKLYEKVLSGERLNLKAPVNGGNFLRENLLPMYK